MFSESHCHLGDVTEEAIRKAEGMGFEVLLTAGIDLISSERAVNTARKYRIVKASVGIHPWYADEYDYSARCVLRDLAGNPEAVAVSEIGLDYTGRMNKEWVYEERIIDKEVQREAFTQQLGLARELDMPVLVHDRAPGQEVLDIIEKEGNAETGAAVHGFSKGPEYAARCVEMGVYLSVGLRPLERGGPDLVEAIRETPINWLLTETDSGNPEGVLTVAGRVAEIKGLTMEEVGTEATRNLMRLLRL